MPEVFTVRFNDVRQAFECFMDPSEPLAHFPDDLKVVDPYAVSHELPPQACSASRQSPDCTVPHTAI
jgi:hypothetical protein